MDRVPGSLFLSRFRWCCHEISCDNHVSCSCVVNRYSRCDISCTFLIEERYASVVASSGSIPLSLASAIAGGCALAVPWEVLKGKGADAFRWAAMVVPRAMDDRAPPVGRWWHRSHHVMTSRLRFALGYGQTIDTRAERRQKGWLHRRDPAPSRAARAFPDQRQH